MSKLPNYFESKRDTVGGLSGYYPFHYDETRKMFVVGDRTVALAKFDPEGLTVDELGCDDDTDSLPYGELPDHPLMLPGFGSAMSGPLLLEWTKANMAGRLPDIVRVIAEAYKQLRPDTDIANLMGAGSHLEFAAGVDHVGRPRLQTLGSCACLSVDVMPDHLW